MENAEYWIKELELEPHPEGGYYKETFRSEETIASESIFLRYGGPRQVYTSILFLLKSGEISCFHRLKSDEIWNFHYGDSLDIHIITPEGKYFIEKLGRNPGKGDSFQVIVKAGCWFGASLQEDTSFALMGCFVAPGFDFRDFEIADRNELLRNYPEHELIIRKLTKP